MNPSTSRSLKNLLLLADLCSGTDLVNLKLVGAWEKLREEHGLCTLLLMLEEHIRNDQDERWTTAREDHAPSPKESESGTGEETPYFSETPSE